MLELMILLVTGLLFCASGVRIWKFNDIRLIHSYHYKNIANENKKAYTEQIGKGVLFIGGGIIATGIVDYFTSSAVGWVCFVVGFAVGLIICLSAQKKYNNSIF